MRCSLCVAAVTLALVALAPSRASAGLVVITSGPTVKPIGDVVDPQKRKALEAAGFPDAMVGYRYDYFGVFWVPLWTWNGSYCVYAGQLRPRPLKPEEAAELLGKNVNELEKPFSYRYPPGLLVLGGILLISIPAGLMKRRGEVKTHAMMADPRYQHALQLYRQGSQNEAAFEEAVLSLEREGIPRNEAIRNLRALLAHLSQREQQTA